MAGTVLGRVRIGVAALIAALAFAACGDDDDAATGSGDDGQAQEQPATDDQAQPEEPEATEGPITLEQAEELAVEAAGGGEATWGGREDERGAAWEVEVTREDGTEVDVLLAEDGMIVSLIPKLSGEDANDDGGGQGGGGGGRQGGGGGTVSRRQAQRAAVAAVGEGRVTWSGREDDRGAALGDRGHSARRQRGRRADRRRRQRHRLGPLFAGPRGPEVAAVPRSALHRP